MNSNQFYVSTQDHLNSAILYALKQGLLFPVPAPRKGATVEELIRWGAMRNLHEAIANHFSREKLPTR